MQRKLAFLFAMLGLSALLQAGLPMVDSQGKPLPSLAPMLQSVNASVVNIATFSTARYVTNPLMNDPFFRHFFDLPNPNSSVKKQQSSAGSGVIVDAKNGIVLTNYHVIKDADEIQVSLVDGRSLDAKLLGSDADLDIAVLKISASNLSEITLADSNRLLVGDFVVAIGNPFGLGQTVTTGIVSALGRSGLGLGFENFIQTDASINPGNSGGALVNLNGELVGINTAIIAPAGGNVGIGFAIPINMAAAVMEQIVNNGHVRRGQVGVSVQELTPNLREAFGLKLGQLGVLIADVQDGSSAQKAGLRPGDVVLAIDEQTLQSTAQFNSILATTTIGKSVEFDVVRNGKSFSMAVEVQGLSQGDGSSSALHFLLQGVEFSNSQGGVVVTSLSSTSRAAKSGLRAGDIVVGVNQVAIRHLNDMKDITARAGNKLLFKIIRGRQYFYVVIS